MNGRCESCGRATLVDCHCCGRCAEKYNDPGRRIVESALAAETADNTSYFRGFTKQEGV